MSEAVVGVLRVFLVLSVLAGSASALPSLRRHPLFVARFDVTSLVSKFDMSLDLRGGQQVRFQTKLQPGVRFIFEDRKPGANWAHPAAVKVVDTSGRVLEEIPVFFPPRRTQGMKSLDDLFLEPSPIKFQINDLGGKYRLKDPEKHYAYLFNGNADPRHWNDFSFLYRVLTTVYGYRPEQILVADSIHRESKPDLDGDGKPDIHLDSTRAALRDTVSLLKSKLSPDHHLLLVLSDHGDRRDGESTIVLADGEMRAREFSELLGEIPATRLLSVFEQCYGGGFVRPAVQGRRVAMSASTDEELSWATLDLNFNEFLYHVIAAFAGQTHEGNQVSSDANGDGRISAQEAYAFAALRDATPESPLLESPANSGMASNIGLSF